MDTDGRILIGYGSLVGPFTYTSGSSPDKLLFRLGLALLACLEKTARYQFKSPLGMYTADMFPRKTKFLADLGQSLSVPNSLEHLGDDG